MLELLAMLKKGHCDGLKVRTGRLQNLISSSCIGWWLTTSFMKSFILINFGSTEHLDFMNQIDLKSLNIQPFGQVHHDYIGYQSLTDVPKALAYSEADYDFSHLRGHDKPVSLLVDTLRSVEGLQGQAFILGLIQQREGPDFVIDNRTGSIIFRCLLSYWHVLTMYILILQSGSV